MDVIRTEAKSLWDHHEDAADTARGVISDKGGDTENSQMQVTFNLWSTLGLVYSVTATPIAIGSYLTFSLVLGGSPFFIYGYIFAVSLNIILCIALAEISSIYPHPSGHIYWVAQMAPEKWSNFLSYWTGVLTVAAWFFWTAGTDLLTAQILLAAVEVLYPGYNSTAWHVVLVAWAQVLITLLWNVPFFKSWPYALKAMILFTNAGVIFVAVSLLVRTHPKQSAQTVFLDIVNESGWTSTGVVFFLGLLPGTTAINGFDSAAHMVEEMPDPRRQVPQVMVGNAFLSGISGLPMVIIFCFCITNVQNLIDPVGGVTIIQIFSNSLQSEALFTIATFFYLLSTIVAATACTTTASRVIWSFSEHNGIPFSKWFSVIQQTRFWAVPVNAISIVVLLSSLVILLNLGPSFVLGAFFSAANVCFYISYAITLCCFLYKKRKHGLPSHYLNLGGVLGNIFDAVSVVWALFASVWLLFPYYLPVTSVNMNYSVVIIAVTIILFAFDWKLRGKRQYTMPPPLRSHRPSPGTEADTSAIE